MKSYPLSLLASRKPLKLRGRSISLLMANLTREQRRTLRARGYFLVTGGKSGRIYLIMYGREGNYVWRLDADGKNLRTRLGLDLYRQVRVRDCAFYAGYARLYGLPPLYQCYRDKRLPIGDCMLAQKAALELYEDKAVRMACAFHVSDYY